MGRAEWIPFLFGFDRRVGPREYATAGLLLTALKVGVDAIVTRLVLGPATPLPIYFKSLIAVGGHASAHPGMWPLFLVTWALPFLWIGVSLTIRRAADAGWSPWWGLLFFVPWVNLALFILLSLVPSSRSATWHSAPAVGTAPAPMRSALQATGLATLVGIVLVVLATKLLGRYTMGLFCGAPFALGALAAYLHNRHDPRPLHETMGVVLITQFLMMGGILLFAIEGLVCIAMAIPLAFPIGCLGGYLGREIALRRPRELGMAGIVAIGLPLAGMMPAPDPPLDQVTSVIEVDAPPEVVWRHVVSFSELPPPREALFQIGVAYPVRARIEGAGVGAVRRCEFSTGAFVEPITVWDAPSRLAFDVAESPLPMEEWSPWRDLYAKHLDSGFRSRRGEFRLVPLPGGRTRLEGRTWYALTIEPHPYWRIQADAIVHTIHRRVLRHVKHLAEEDAQQVAAIRPAVPLDRSGRRP